MNLMAGIRNKLFAWGLSRLGRRLEQRGLHQLAAWCLREAQQYAPHDVEALYESAKLYWQSQEMAQARQQLSLLLAQAPGHVKARNLLGVIAQVDGEFGAAEECFRSVLKVAPDWAAPHNNLGNVLLAVNDFIGAEACFRKALTCDDGYAEAWCNLAQLLNRTGRYEEAEDAARMAIRLRPDFAGAMNNLGSILLNRGKLAEGAEQYKKAVELQPDLIEAQINLALSMEEEGRLVAAMDHFRQMLERNPDSYLALLRIAQGYLALKDFDEAENYVRRLLEIKPDAYDALVLLGRISVGQGLNRQTLEISHQILALAENFGQRISLIFHSLYENEASGRDLLELARDWVRRFTVDGAGSVKRTHDEPDFGRKLRVGYVSKDFFKHSVSYFLEPVLAHHDKSKISVYCYSMLLHGDVVTDRLKTYADHWRDIALVNDSDVIKMIEEDEIDVLVDLSGYTSGGRLTVFAHKPAPVQISYLGCPVTTGLTAMDYRLVDALTDPAGEADHCHTETLWRLPGSFLAYQPPAVAPEVDVPPCLANGHVTFGSFNNALKVTEQVVEVWSKILHALPGSRLMLKSLTFSSQRGKDYFQSLFESQGLGPERVELFAWLPETSGHLGLYGRIDIALDPFPYHGTTTTCESLWMGVPVITLAGERHSARVGVSLLNQVGLTALIAESAEEYVRKAVALAEDREHLASLRAGLRARMKNSPLLDHAGFTRRLEDAYLEMRMIAAERTKTEHKKLMA